MDKAFFNHLKSEIENWHKTQQNQKSGYEYERSLSELMNKLGQEILQTSMGKVPSSRNKKKD